MPQVRRIEQAGAASDREVQRAAGGRDRPRGRSPRGWRAPSRELEPAPQTLQALELGSAARSPPARSTSISASATGTVAGQLVDEEEQQVEGEREHGAQHGAAQLRSAPPRNCEQRAEHAGDEQIAVADHGGAETARSAVAAGPAAGWAALSASVGALQQIGDDQRASATAIATIPAAEPARGRDACQQYAERDSS